jgi:hypothetical protein
LKFEISEIEEKAKHNHRGHREMLEGTEKLPSLRRFRWFGRKRAGETPLARAPLGCAQGGQDKPALRKTAASG